MIFKATENQIKQIAANAVMASKPVGLGFLHFDDEEKFSPENFLFDPRGGMHLDYVGGRMVKLNIWREENGDWRMRDEISSEYESWIRKYPTVQDLVRSAGVEI